jgi:phospholipid/cholesterol/gamma-HCH transport system substrate-binding protein
VGEMIDELRAKIFPVIDETQVAIQNFSEVAKKMRASGDEVAIGRFLTDDQFAKDLERLIAGLNQNLKQVDPILTDLKMTTRNVSEFSVVINEQSRELPELIQSLKTTLASVEAVMTDLKRTTPQLPKIAGNVGDASDSLPVLVLQIQQVMVDLELLVKQLQSHWLFGGNRPEDTGQSSRITPLEVSP